MPFFFPSCSLGCILLLLSVFFPGVFGADRNFTELSNKNGIDVCTMESKMLLLCDTNSQPSRRSGFPNPNPCSCNTIFFNLFCACQLSQGVTYRPGWTDFTARCNDAGMNVTQSTNYTLPFNMPLWVNQDAKDDRFDEDNAFRLVENTQDSSNQGLGPGTIVGIATGGVAVLAFLGFLIWKVRTTRRANQRHRKKNLGGWSSPFSTTFGFASRQTVTKKRKETQWAIDEEPDNAETYEILARPFTKNSAAPSLGAVHPHAPNSEINNPFNHNLAERAHHERNASTTSTLTPLSGWAAFRRKIRLAFYSMPLPGRNVVPVKHYKPSMAFQVDDRDGPYDPYLGGSKKSRNSGGSPQDPAHGRSTSQASFISAGGRPVSAYEELSEHFDLDTTGSRTNLAEGGAGRSGRTEEERLLEPSSSHGYQRTTTTPSTHGLYDYSPSSRPNSNPLPYGESTTAVYGGSSGNLLSGDVLDISRDNNLLASSSSGDRRANNISSSTVSSTASQRPERNNHNRKPSDRLQQRLPPAPSSLAPSPSSAQSFTSGHGRDASGSSSTFSQIPPLQPQVSFRFFHTMLTSFNS
ncbi:hypothetical protein DL96DRAFT_212125 [Flagelloscypha sp. PMI_526]|nr:hypothetical protein DL96DRAFT_212125 [Flagelloscypha sp. PMI_526]